MSANLTCEEFDAFKKQIESQYRDGWGSAFELLNIQADDASVVCLRLFHGGLSFYTTDELDAIYQPKELQSMEDVTVQHPDATPKPQPEKPPCPLIGADGNIFNLIGLASRTLKRSGMRAAAQEMQSRVTSSGSYESALAIIQEYVTPVDADGQAQDGFSFQM